MVFVFMVDEADAWVCPDPPPVQGRRLGQLVVEVLLLAENQVLPELVAARDEEVTARPEPGVHDVRRQILGGALVLIGAAEQTGRILADRPDHALHPELVVHLDPRRNHCNKRRLTLLEPAHERRLVGRHLIAVHDLPGQRLALQVSLRRFEALTITTLKG